MLIAGGAKHIAPGVKDYDIGKVALCIILFGERIVAFLLLRAQHILLTPGEICFQHDVMIIRVGDEFICAPDLLVQLNAGRAPVGPLKYQDNGPVFLAGDHLRGLKICLPLLCGEGA